MSDLFVKPYWLSCCSSKKPSLLHALYLLPRKCSPKYPCSPPPHVVQVSAQMPLIERAFLINCLTQTPTTHGCTHALMHTHTHTYHQGLSFTQSYFSLFIWYSICLFDYYLFITECFLPNISSMRVETLLLFKGLYTVPKEYLAHWKQSIYIWWTNECKRIKILLYVCCESYTRDWLIITV